ncbi:MAG: hypothetical protein M0029_05235 [Actinomycetota bacterium]|jgi:hypothetical protein|nr:hypothetical protein [Actinomycetota bacterium]
MATLGRVSDVVAAGKLHLAGFDAYVTGSRLTLTDCVATRASLGAERDRIPVDSYGT